MPDHAISAHGAASLGENWDCYRYFLAVARNGSLSGAAKALRESQPTVGRKIRDLESRLGSKLFERGAAGIRLTPAGQRTIDHVELIEAELRAIADQVGGVDDSLEGKVVVTAPEGFGLAVLAPQVSSFADIHPGIDLELLLDTSKLRIVNREADVAVRIGDPVHASLVGRRVGAARFAFFASPRYLEREGVPARPAELVQHRLVDAAGALRDVAQAAHLRSIAFSARRVLTTDSVVAQLRATETGAGIAMLPRYLARDNAQLVEILPDSEGPSVDVWVLTHNDLKDVARVRAVMDFMVSVAGRALS